MIVAQHFAPHLQILQLQQLWKVSDRLLFRRKLADEAAKRRVHSSTTFGRFCTTLYHYNLFEDSRRTLLTQSKSCERLLWKAPVLNVALL